MRILVLADIHSNWAALSAIDERFDVCLFVGDAVDYGTAPRECLDWLRANKAICVRGNHDHAVAQRIKPRPGAGFRRLTAATRSIHWDILNEKDLTYLAKFPVTRQVSIADHTFLMLHATPRDPLDEYLTDDKEAWQQRLTGNTTDFVCVGHTHVPFHLDLGEQQVLNPGSVGQPRDGDPRSSYVIIEDGRVEFRRIDYDIDAAVQSMRDAGMAPQLVEMSENVLRSGGQMA
ncbi:MAG: metallophosphoesterase family protein [Planctomycetota bacterium]|nr:metallophosphoesterase family protein [Planctomycetota bacterium]